MEKSAGGRVFRFNALSSVVLILLFLAAANANAQDKEETETLVKGKVHNGWMISFEDKLSEVNGSFTNFAGFQGGWIINHSFLIGFTVLGSTSDNLVDMAYGGLRLEYFLNSKKLLNYSFSALVGGGCVDSFRGHHGHEEGFFVAEPGAHVTLNVLRNFRIGFGAGYRFVSGGDSRLDLSAPTMSFSFKFGSF